MNLKSLRKKEINEKLEEFKNFDRTNEKKVFAELSFCICTPQSNAKFCWNAIFSLMKNKKLYNGNKKGNFLNSKKIWSQISQ